MGDLFEQFEAASRRTPLACKMARLMEELKPDQLEALSRAMASPDIGSPSITTVLRAWGHQVNQSTVARHRKGNCACEGS